MKKPPIFPPSAPGMIRISLAMVANRGVLGGALALGLCQLASAGDWPQWRGPLLNGSTAETGLPVEFGPTKNLSWVAPLPGPSGATPVVAAQRVFVVAADKAGEDVLGMCLDANTGRELWRHPLCSNHGTPGGNDMGAPSPVTDGERVWFLTGNGMLACFSTKEGAELWRRDLGKDYGTFVLNYGYSSSPFLFDGKLYVVALQNEDPHCGGLNSQLTGPMDSYLLALDPATGKTLWKQVRETDATSQSREAYMTPSTASPTPRLAPGRSDAHRPLPRPGAGGGGGLRVSWDPCNTGLSRPVFPVNEPHTDASLVCRAGMDSCHLRVGWRLAVLARAAR